MNAFYKPIWLSKDQSLYTILVKAIESPQSTSHIQNVCIVWTLTIASEDKSQQRQSQIFSKNLFSKNLE